MWVPVQSLALRVSAVLAAILLAVCLSGCGSDNSPAASDTAGETYESGYDEYEGDPDPEVVAQDEWENQEGEAWDEFTEGYAAGWDSGCDIAFEGSPDGSLYDQGVEYTADDCYALAPFDASDTDVPFEVPYDPSGEGHALGESDGCVAAFEELASYGVLNWGEDSYDESVCP